GDEPPENSNDDQTAVSIAIAIARNAIDADVTARVTGVSELGAAALQVTAENSATISAEATSIAVALSAAKGDSTAVGGAGVVSVNTITGSVLAEIADSAVTAEGAVVVEARNDATITAII